jgi:serine phosphatase RsbU (regulator of sigma subunit)
MASSLRFWLLFSFSIVLSTCLIAIWLFISAMNRAKSLESYKSNVTNLRTLVFETNRIKEEILFGEENRSEFYTSSRSRQEQRFHQKQQQIAACLKYLFGSSHTSKYHLIAKVDTIACQVGSLHHFYNKLIYFYKLKGFKDFGLEGKMREYAHVLYEHPDIEVKLRCLTLRKHEKDFLLRKERFYVRAFSSNVNSFVNYLNRSTKFRVREKNQLLSALYHYNQNFLALARIETKIGVKGKHGYLNLSYQKFDSLKSEIDLLENLIEKAVTQQKAKLKRDIVIVVISLVVFLAISIMLLIRLITRSAKSIARYFSNYVNSGFRHETFTYPKSRIKEFNIIYLSFLKMAKEINVFTNFFREKVHERTLAIQKQKDEIVAQQEQITKQYDKLLRKNRQLKVQKQLLYAKNLDINDSLHYAKRIQKALQPSRNRFIRQFPESFIFTKAKDVVSGDFHLVHEVPITADQPQSKTIIVTADCTGHGVPGAMMSILGINIINKLVHELQTICPALILEKLDKDIVKLLADGKRTEEIVADGMDIAVFSLDREAGMLEYSVAKFGCLYLREGQVIPLEVNRQSIGHNYPGAAPKKFQSTRMEIKRGDQLYLFSDGYEDQFGGALNKKYKKARLRDTLMEISNQSPDTQKAVLRDNFKSWKGRNSQTDDVLIMGIKF